MGVFNSVLVRCPECAEDLELQSKAVDGCRVYNAHTAVALPQPIAEDISGEQVYCPHCQRTFTVRVLLARVETLFDVVLVR